MIMESNMRGKYGCVRLFRLETLRGAVIQEKDDLFAEMVFSYVRVIRMQEKALKIGKQM